MGFFTEHELAERGAKLVIPPRIGDRDEYSLQETKEGKVVSRARIHIERFNKVGL